MQNLASILTYSRWFHWLFLFLFLFYPEVFITFWLRLNHSNAKKNLVWLLCMVHSLSLPLTHSDNFVSRFCQWNQLKWENYCFVYSFVHVPSNYLSAIDSNFCCCCCFISLFTADALLQHWSHQYQNWVGETVNC